MFKFNFALGTQEDELSENIREDYDENSSKKLKTEEASEVITEYGVLKYKEIISNHLHMNRNIVFKKMHIDLQSSESQVSIKEETKHITIDYVDSYKLQIDKENDLAEINKTHDLVPGKYEGGLKVWELSIDLARFLYNINHFDLEKYQFKCLESTSLNQFQLIKNFFNKFSNSSDNSDSKEIRILELGCGHALPSLSVCKYLDDAIYEIYTKSMKNLKIIVHLQDFNKQIVEDITFENVKKFIEIIKEKWTNTPLGEIPFEIIPEFVYGDWKDLNNKNTLPKDYYNLILSSETIYNSENYKSLLDLFKKCLIKKENEAFVLLSSKTYYFGCGGNLSAFIQLAKKAPYNFNSSDNLLYSDEFYLGNTTQNNLKENDENS